MSEKQFAPVTAPGLRFIKPSQLAKDGVTGEILEGIYVEPVANPFEEGKQDYKFETADGELVVLNGAGNLGYQMKEVKPGTLVRINYSGKQVIKTGPRKGKEAHNFTVLAEKEA